MHTSQYNSILPPIWAHKMPFRLRKFQLNDSEYASHLFTLQVQLYTHNKQVVPTVYNYSTQYDQPTHTLINLQIKYKQCITRIVIL